jgi:hypothetical protein
VNQKSNLEIVVHLTNTLKAPRILFEFVLPPDNIYGKDPIVQENLKKFQQDEIEMNKQVFSLLLFNSFFSNTELKNSLPSFISGTVGQMISGYLSSWLSRVFRNSDFTPYLSVNSNYDVTSAEFVKALQASASVGIRKAWYDGRLIVTVGGNFDVNNPYILSARNTNVLLTPDITVEWILSKNGKWRIAGFNRTNIDQTFGQRNRTGVKISHHVEFDRKRKKPKIKKTG